MRCVRILAVLLNLCLTTGQASAQVTTTCAPPASAAAGAICSNPALGQADAALAQAHAALAARLAADQKAVLQDNHRTWVAYRDSCGANATCLASAIAERTAALQAALGGPTEQQAATAVTTDEAGRMVSEAYQSLAAKLAAPQRRELDANQRQWATQTEQTCGGDASCLLKAMNDRTAALRAALRPAASQGQTAQSVLVPQGSWYGRMACTERGQSFEIETEFTALSQPNGTYTMRMVLVGPNAMSSGSSEFDLVGEPSQTATGAIRFVISEVRRSSLFGGNERFSLEFDPAGGSVRVDGLECNAFTARLMAPEDPRLRITAPLPTGGGLYDRAADDRNRCEVLIAWSERLNKEFPGRNFYRESLQGDEFRKILLFADDDFVPVFGLPYDAMPYEARKTIARFSRNCHTDPFTRDRLEAFAANDRVFSGNPEQQLTSDGYSAAVFAIREIRSLRNAARAEPLSNGQDFEEVLSQFDQDRARLKQYAERLWPSEIADLDGAIVARISAVASVEAERRLAIARLEQDPAKALSLMEEARASALMSRLTEADARKREEAVQALVDSLVDRVMAPVLAKAADVTRDLQGLAELEALLDAPVPSALPTDRKTALRVELERRLSALLETLVSERIKSMTSIDGAGQKILEADATARRTFDQDFASFVNHAVLKTAKTTLDDHREKLLDRSLPEFEAAIALAQTKAEAEQLLAAYLSLPGDMLLPVSLEFQLLLASMP